jgi:prolipoprotein diacylglyceryl transferase
MIVAYIPSPSISYFSIFNLKIHFYAIFIILAIIVGCVIAAKRYKKCAGLMDTLFDIYIWAILFGIIGARLYHVLTDYKDYFTNSGAILNIVKVWNGGLSIWGAIIFGVFGAYIGAKRAGVSIYPLLDSVAPALLVAQSIGRIGNYFNQEIFGRPTSLSIGLKLSDNNTINAGYPIGTLFQPLFLYEIIWLLIGVVLLLWIDKKKHFMNGELFYLYVTFYCFGRLWLESLRIDYSIMVFGTFRINEIVSLILFLFGLTMFIITYNKHKNDKIAQVLDDTNLTNEYHFVIDDSMKSKEDAEKLYKKNNKTLEKEPVKKDKDLSSDKTSETDSEMPLPDVKSGEKILRRRDIHKH